MKIEKIILLTVMLFSGICFSAKAQCECNGNCVWSSPIIFLEDGYQWCDQFVVPMGNYYKSQLQGSLIEGHSYRIIVRSRYWGILYSGTATYTGNELWDNDNLIGFHNIDHDVSSEDQDEILGDDYCDDDFDVFPPVCIHVTFVFNFQVGDTDIPPFYIEIYDECTECGDENYCPDCDDNCIVL